MPPCQWYLRTYASHPCCLLCCTLIPWQMFALLLSLIKVWMVPLVLGPENAKLFCPGNKGNMWTHLTTAHIFTVCFFFFWLSEMSSGPENPAASLHIIDVQISPRVTDIQDAFLDAAADCGKWQWFSEVLLSPLWLYLTPQHDSFLCNAIGGVKGQAHSPELSCLALHVLWFLWIPWIFSQYYVW